MENQFSKIWKIAEISRVVRLRVPARAPGSHEFPLQATRGSRSAALQGANLQKSATRGAATSAETRSAASRIFTSARRGASRIHRSAETRSLTEERETPSVSALFDRGAPIWSRSAETPIVSPLFDRDAQRACRGPQSPAIRSRALLFGTRECASGPNHRRSGPVAKRRQT